MLTAITPTPPRQFPLALLSPTPAEDWLREEADSLDVASVEPAGTAEALASEIPLALLRRLVTDRSLRAEIEADPAAALAGHGIHVAPEALPAKVRLPDTRTLREAIRCHCGEEAEAAILRFYGYFGGNESDDD